MASTKFPEEKKKKTSSKCKDTEARAQLMYPKNSKIVTSIEGRTVAKDRMVTGNKVIYGLLSHILDLTLSKMGGQRIVLSREVIRINIS